MNTDNKHSEYMKKYHKDRHAADPIAYKLDIMLRSARTRAIKKKVRFNLDIEYLHSIATEYCPYFPDIKLAYAPRKRGGVRFASPSLDRIIPKRGYVKGNVEIISMKANMIKSNGTSKDLYTIADRVYEFERGYNGVLSISPNEPLDVYRKRIRYYTASNLVGYSYTQVFNFVNNKLRGWKK